jgi:thiol:disulfide interchange protein DsbD
MIPVTVSFIGGAAGGNRRRAVMLSSFYLAGMAAIYSSLGVMAAIFGKQFGNFTRSPIIYGAVALIIALFGLVMLDVVTIPVPGFFGKVQSDGARRGGKFGALLMGLASGFVAAPCTAPVLALLLAYVAKTRDVLWGGTLMLFFALGLGLLLMILGIFSGLLAGLPRAGAWMDWIKKAFGIGMLLAACYFAYQVVHMLLYPTGGG